MATINYISNTNQLESELNSILEVLINDITEKAYDMLIKILNETIYQPQPSDAWYNRTFEFRDKAWVKEMKHSLKNHIGRVYFDGMRMSPQSYSVNAGYSHGNLEQGIDRRKDMAWILQNEYDNFMNADWIKAPGAYYAQDYWDLFIKKIDMELDNLCTKEFRKYGLEVKKVG